MNKEHVTWDDSFSVGFELIDDQHKELVNMVNGLFESCDKGAAAADKAFLQTIKKAADYTRDHFSTEDKYMVLASFPNISEHRKQHDEFFATVLKAMKEFESGKTAPHELAQFLKSWLLNHIAVSDKQYAPFLAKMGKS